MLTAGELVRLLKERGEDEAWYENAPVGVCFARWEPGADRAEESPIEYLCANATDVVLDSGHMSIEAETAEGPDGMSRMMRLSKPGPGGSGVRRYMGIQAEVRWDDVRDAGITLEEATAAFDDAERYSTLLAMEHGMEDGKEPEPGARWKMTVHEPDRDWKEINPTLGTLMALAWYGLVEIGTDG